MANKQKTYLVSDFASFIVTGETVDGKRFRREYSASPSGWMTANGINLYNGNVWGVLKSTGKRKLLKSVIN